MGLALLCAAGIAESTEAQVNIEKLRGANPHGLGILAEFDGRLRTGSVDRQELGGEAFAQLDYARQRRLDGWAVAGAGLRLARREGDHELFLGTAYMLEYEVNDLPPGARHRRRTTHHRWRNHLSGVLPLWTQTRLEVTACAQPRFDAPADLRLLGEASMAVDVAGPVRLARNGSLRYDSEPVDGVDPVDARLRLRLGVQL